MSNLSQFTANLRKVISFSLENWFYLLLAFLAAIFVGKYISNFIKYNKKKREYLIKKNRRGALTKITEELKEYRFMKKILDNLAIKIGMYTEYSHDKNTEYATVFCLGTFVFSIFVLGIIVPTSQVVWYIILFYIIIAIAFVALVIYVFSVSARAKFTEKLPDTFKILNSRYINTGNILKSINISMGDFDKSIRREMLKIYDVLRKNDMGKIEKTFKRIEDTYKNEHLTLLLNLIKQAHFKGGNEVIKDQFEQATEDILISIENKKDLTSTTRSYILMSLFIPLAIKGIEVFNASALDEEAMNFYQNLSGIQFKMFIIVAMMVYVLLMLFKERSI